jgi:hypothetical protein
MDFKNVFFYFLLQGKLFQPRPLMFVFFLWQSKQIQISIQRPIPVLTFYLHHLLMNIAHVKLNNNQSLQQKIKKNILKIHVITNLVLMGKVIIFSHTDLWPGYNDLDTSAASHWQALSHDVVSSTPHHEQDLNSQLLWW